MSKDNNVLDSIVTKIKRKEQARKTIKDYLKPECEEKLSEEEYPKIKDND